ncbi:hypothetical protein MASR1M36_18220 [Candidatus Cloacimonadaceae bacterium]
MIFEVFVSVHIRTIEKSNHLGSEQNQCLTDITDEHDVKLSLNFIFGKGLARPAPGLPWSPRTSNIEVKTA